MLQDGLILMVSELI